MVQKLEKLNKQEINFIKQTSLKEYLEEDIQQMRQYKTFIKEIRKLEKKFGHDNFKDVNIMNMITKLGLIHFECLEDYVVLYADDLTAGARKYFDNYY